MKIALLGASGSGKTTYFSGVYAKFRNAVSFPNIDEMTRAVLLAQGATDRLSFRVKFDNLEVEEILSFRADNLKKRPPVFPDPTPALDAARLSVGFLFKSLEDDEGVTRHDRNVELFDPPGGAFIGRAHDSSEIVRILRTCDVFNIFIDADRILEALDEGGIELLQSSLTLGPITELIEKASSGLSSGDIVPICFIISKFDRLHKSVTKDVEQLVYADLIKTFSEEHKDYMICICQTAVVDPESELFSAHNLEWPFIFSCAGTIFRNSIVTMARASERRAEAAYYERRASEVRSGGWWKRLTSYIGGNGVNVNLRQAESYRTQEGRLVSVANDDRQLAARLWSYLALQGKADGIKVIMQGREIDPADVVGV